MLKSSALLTDYLLGVDRANPFTTYDLDILIDQGVKVIGYYVPSQWASVSWTVEQAKLIKLRKPTMRVIPIYVPPLNIEGSAWAVRIQGRTCAAEAMKFLGHGYPHDGWVALDVEENTTGDYQSLISGWVAFLDEHGMKPLVYSSHNQLAAASVRHRGWYASWLDTELADWDLVIQRNNQPILTSVPYPGWQYAGNIAVPGMGDSLITDVVDVSIWKDIFSTPQSKGSPSMSSVEALPTTTPDAGLKRVPIPASRTGVKTYTTMGGDNLLRISASQGIPEDDIENLNPGVNFDALAPGTNLILGYDGYVPVPVAAAPPAPPVVPSEQGFIMGQQGTGNDFHAQTADNLVDPDFVAPVIADSAIEAQTDRLDTAPPPPYVAPTPAPSVEQIVASTEVPNHPLQGIYNALSVSADSLHVAMQALQALIQAGE